MAFFTLIVVVFCVFSKNVSEQLSIEFSCSYQIKLAVYLMRVHFLLTNRPVFCLDQGDRLEFIFQFIFQK